ncbi:uncharacterized protein PF3D7_1120000-like [Petaurus breviceps papuanus]|uniref:uncharacterized protein PF3D7_1120000-like n=1 Tax=Petaurus breviceps papuanus TaxID=3040969 RepID=UPI0036D98170
MSETIQARDMEANTNEEPPNPPEAAETSDDAQAVAHVQEEVKLEIPRNIITWIKDAVKEFEQELKLERRYHNQIKEELTEMREFQEELVLEFENAQKDHCQLISKMTNIDARIESLQELIDAANRRLSIIGIRIAENISEIEKEAEKTTELLKILEMIQQQVKDLEAGSKCSVTDVLENL